MKENEDYLDELLRSMGEEDIDLSGWESDSIDENMISVDAMEVSKESGMGQMDQAMIDALLASAGNSDVGMVEDMPVLVDEADLDAFLAAEAAADKDSNVADLADLSTSLEDDRAKSGTEEVVGIYADSEENIELESSSMLAKLMAEMEMESQEIDINNFDDESLLTEDSIEALLSAAQSGAEEEVISFDNQNDDDMGEIEALLNMADGEQLMDESEELLQMLEAENNDTSFSHAEESEQVLDMDELDAILSSGESKVDGAENADHKKKKKEKKPKEKKEKKEKKTSDKKGFFKKIFDILMEEVPEEENISIGDSLKLSDENKDILNELDQEKGKKVKVKEKKEKKPKKEKPPKEKKPKKEKPPKEKKPKKEKPKKEKPPYIPEKRIPRKKVVVTVVFAASVMILILLVEYLAVPMLTVGRARSAFDKGEYYEAYKEYYGQKLSEEDEKRFQGATAVMRMQSNLDGYHNYLKLKQDVKALHSLLEAVRVKFDVFLKAEEFDVLSQVTVVYDEILNILSSKYHLSEEDAMDLIQEKSDAVYTRKLESLVGNEEYTKEGSEIDQSDLLPEEELFFD